MSWPFNIKHLNEIEKNKNPQVTQNLKSEKIEINIIKDFIKNFPNYERSYLDIEERPFMKCKSLYLKDKNGEITNKFSGSDSEEEFKKNLSIMPADWKYRTKEIIYNVNKDGYRTYDWKEINWKEAIVLFGCSCTFGIGLAEDETLSYYLEKLTGRQVINIGVPGGSNYVIADNCASMIKYFDAPYGVVFNWTGHQRFRYFYETGWTDVGSWNKDKKAHLQENKEWKIDVYNLLHTMTLNPYNAYANGRSLRKSVDAMLKNRSKVIHLTFFKDAKEIMDCEENIESIIGSLSENRENVAPVSARDCFHPGSDSVENMAKHIHKRFS